MPNEETALDHLDEDIEVTEEATEETSTEKDVEEEVNPLAHLDDSADEIEKPPVSDEKISADVDDENSDEDEDADDQEEEVVEVEEEEVEESIPVELLVEAGKAGLTAEQVKAFPNADSLKAAMALVQPKTTDAADDDADKGGGSDDSKSDEVPEFEEIKIEISDEFDDETKELFSSLERQFNEKLKGIHGQLNEKLADVSAVRDQNRQMKEQMENASRNEFFEWYDGQLDSLGDEWGKTFGKGPMADLAQDSSEAKNRIDLTIEMDKLHQSHPDWNKKKLLDASIKLLFPSEHEKITADRSQKKKSDYRKKSVTQKPTAKNTEISAPPSRKKATSAARKVLEKLGF